MSHYHRVKPQPFLAACRGTWIADVIAKLCIVEEEADECLYWMEPLIDSEILHESRLQGLMIECNESLSMTVALTKTLRRKQSEILAEEQMDCVYDRNHMIDEDE